MKRADFLRRHFSGLLVASLLLSLLFHFTLVPLIVWLLRGRPLPNAPQEIVHIATSSIVRITHRTRPLPARHPHVTTAHRQPIPRRQVQPQPRSAPARREIARINPRAVRPVPPKAQYSRSTLNTAQQENQFEKTIARLREENNPVISAARPVQTPEAAKHYTYDFSGSLGTAPSAEGILTPEKSWHEDGYDYYYVRYWVQYPDGTTETGIVPWPLRYRPEHDPFRLGIEHFPLPVPLPDYTLPPGTVLHPLVAFCYKHREELDDCPIYHE